MIPHFSKCRIKMWVPIRDTSSCVCTRLLQGRDVRISSSIRYAQYVLCHTVRCRETMRETVPPCAMRHVYQYHINHHVRFAPSCTLVSCLKAFNPRVFKVPKYM